MKKIIYFILGVFLLASSFNAVHAAEKVRLASGEYLPYLSENLKHYGFGSHIVTDAFAAAGIEVEYGFFPWKRSLKLAKKGVWDGTILWVYTEEREKYFYYSDPVISGRKVFFHLKSTPFDWNTIDDLKGYRIAVSLGYSYGKLFDEAVKSGKINVWAKPTDKENFQRIIEGKSQIFPMNLEAGIYTIKKIFSSSIARQITYHPRTLDSYSYHLLLPKKKPGSEQMIKQFNKGLKILIEDGRFDQYYKDALDGKYEK